MAPPVLPTPGHGGYSRSLTAYYPPPLQKKKLLESLFHHRNNANHYKGVPFKPLPNRGSATGAFVDKN